MTVAVTCSTRTSLAAVTETALRPIRVQVESWKLPGRPALGRPVPALAEQDTVAGDIREHHLQSSVGTGPELLDHLVPGASCDIGDPGRDEDRVVELHGRSSTTEEQQPQRNRRAKCDREAETRDSGGDRAALEQQLRDLDRVERGALAEAVARDEEDEPALSPMCCTSIR
jgi:hypothetical protein